MLLILLHPYGKDRTMRKAKLLYVRGMARACTSNLTTICSECYQKTIEKVSESGTVSEVWLCLTKDTINDSAAKTVIESNTLSLTVVLCHMRHWFDMNLRILILCVITSIRFSKIQNAEGSEKKLERLSLELTNLSFWSITQLLYSHVISVCITRMV